MIVSEDDGYDVSILQGWKNARLRIGIGLIRAQKDDGTRSWRIGDKGSVLRRNLELLSAPRCSREDNSLVYLHELFGCLAVISTQKKQMSNAV
jgi:hypothetical protein